MAILRQGSKGDEVRLLQEQLKAAGYDPGPIDADYGPLTAGAVTALQKAKGLGVDAIAGPQTFGALQTMLAPQASAPAPSPTIPQGMTPLATPQLSAQQPAAQTPSFTMPKVDLTPRYDYSDEIQAALQALRGNIGNANVTPQQIVSSPEYLAQKGVLDLQRGEGMAALRRDFASRNMLQGTPAIQAFTTAQGEADIRAGALVPQMMGEARGQLQQQIANQLQGLQALVNQQKTEDQYSMQKAQLLQDVANTQRNFGLSESGVTGTYQGKPTYAATQAATTAAQRQADAVQLAAQKQTEFDWMKQQDTTANQLNQQQFDWTKQYQQGVLNKPAAASAATVRTPKQQYEDTIYNKLAQGVSLTEDEKRFLGITPENVRSVATSMAQKDDAWYAADEAVQMQLIEKYIRMLQGPTAAPTTSKPTSEDDWAKQGGYLK